MKFKKSVSALAALTLSVTAFAGLAVTANAMETVTIDYEGDSPVVDWSTKTSGRYTPTISVDGENHYMDMTNDNYNNGTTVYTNNSYTAIVDANNSFTMEFSMAITGGNNQTSTFEVQGYDGDILKLTQTAVGNTSYKINDDDTSTIDLTKGAWYNFKITRIESDNSSDDITYLTVTDVSGNATSYTQKVISSSLSTNGGVKGMSFATGRYYAGLKIDNVTVRDVDEANDVPSLPEHNYIVNLVNGDTILDTIVGTAKETAGYLLTGLPEVIEKDGVYYQLDSSVKNHTVGFTMGTSDEIQTIEYVKDDTIVYYAEGESAAASRESAAAIISANDVSGGKGKQLTGTNYYLSFPVTIEEKATYTIYVNQGARASSKGTPYKMALYDGDTELGQYTGAVTGTALSNTEVVLDKGEHELKTVVVYNGMSPIDYVLIKRTGDAPVVAPTAKVETVGERQTTGTGADAQAYKATFTANEYTATKLVWSVNPADGVEAAAETLEQDLPALTGDTEYVAGLVVTATDFDKVKDVTATIK